MARYNFSSNRRVILEDLGRPKTYRVKKTFIHPDFNQNYAFADIRLYQLNESVKFNQYKRPACLSLNGLSAVGNLTQIGWDETNIRSNNLLHKIPLSYISNKRCKDVYKNTNSRLQIKDLDKKTIFCAESKKGNRRMINVSKERWILKGPHLEKIGFAFVKCQHLTHSKLASC